MAGRRKHRGVSIGTILMLSLTCLVLLGYATVIPRLAGNTKVNIDTGKVLQALSLGDGLPELSLSDIPISVIRPEPTAVPAMKPAATMAPVAQNTQVPTLVPTAAPTATPVPGGRFTATFGGSVIVNTELRQDHYFKEAETYDFADVLTLVKDEFGADLSMVTLENSIYSDAKLSDTNTAAEALSMLSSAGVDAVALGYRNAADNGLDGVNATITAVKAEGMTALGAYASAEDAQLARCIMELGGVKVAVLHYTDALTDKGAKAIKKADAAYALPVDAVSNGADAILADVAAVRQQGAQVVIVSLSWSAASGKSAPTKKQIAFAQQLADAGVDVIIGAGSRVVQPVTWLTGTLADGSTKQTLCAYSLGSLVNGSRTNANVAAMLLHLDISYDGKKVSFNEVSYTPTYIWRFKQDGRYYYRVVASHQPAPDGMAESQAESMARALDNVQKYLGTDTPLTLR